MSTLSDNLKQLMSEKQIKTAELARRVELPQPTVHRIVTGKTPHPHGASIERLAEFFDLTPDQLRGIETLPTDTGPAGLTNVPLISWDAATQWPSNRDVILAEKPTTLFVDSPISDQGYALTLRDSAMAPQFPEGTTVILDPDKPMRDRGYIAVFLQETQQVIFRQVLMDGEMKYLKPLSPDLEHFQMRLLEDGDKYRGSLVQARRNYDD